MAFEKIAVKSRHCSRRAYLKEMCVCGLCLMEKTPIKFKGKPNNVKDNYVHTHTYTHTKSPECTERRRDGAR